MTKKKTNSLDAFFRGFESMLSLSWAINRKYYRAEVLTINLKDIYMGPSRDAINIRSDFKKTYNKLFVNMDKKNER